MAGKIRHLLHRDGRYYARRVVPKELRILVGKNELRTPLGPDRRRAIAMLPSALVIINATIDHAQRKLDARGPTGEARKRAGLQAMTPSEMARAHYAQRLALDEVHRNSGPQWASVSINDGYVRYLRSVLSGRSSDEEIQLVLGEILGSFQLRGNLVAKSGSPEWRAVTRALAGAELAALERVVERDEGLSPQQQIHPTHLEPESVDTDTPFTPPISLMGLLEDHIRQLEQSGRGRAARAAWPRIFESLLAFLKQHRALKGVDVGTADNANLLSPEEVIAWRDEALGRLKAKTVKDVWLAALKAVLQHAVEDRRIGANPARDVKVRGVSPVKVRAQGYTDEEALRVLAAALSYSRAERSNPATTESEPVAAAKRWAPWLCAVTGARVGEILQLRKSDISNDAGIDYIHITPEAGTVKNRAFRDIPIHPQLIEQGFLDFVAGSNDGPLFFSAEANLDKLPARTVAGRVSTWLRKAGLVPAGVSPSHGWRHRFSTLSTELGIDPKVQNAIQGHAGTTAADHYGEVTLRAKKAAIDRFPRYEIDLD
ncbi:MAG: tyrosine-type recombinase/integrase [Devosia sp.]